MPPAIHTYDPDIDKIRDDDRRRHREVARRRPRSRREEDARASTTATAARPPVARSAACPAATRRTRPTTSRRSAELLDDRGRRVSGVGSRIVAVVVTWNRAELLARILRAIDAQADPAGRGRRGRQRLHRRDARRCWTGWPPSWPRRSHVAPAGPQHRRRRRLPRRDWRRRSRLDADLLWLMDDDGQPPPDCLATLLAHVDRYDFLGPAVVAEDDQRRLCFPIRIPGTARVVHDLADVERAAVGRAARGRRHPVQRRARHPGPRRRGSGCPARSSSSGATTSSTSGGRGGPVPASRRSCRRRFLHPATDDLGTPMMFGRTTYNHSPSDLKHYCMVRNNVTNLREYVGRARGAGVPGQDRCGSTCSPGRGAAGSGSAPRRCARGACAGTSPGTRGSSR